MRGHRAGSGRPAGSSADLHLHTTCSDGAVTPGRMAAILAGGPLAVAAVTDHDTIRGALAVREALAGRRPEIIVGSEVSTLDGHVIGLFLEHDLPRGLAAAETVERIHAQGGLAVAPHPCFPVHSVGGLCVRVPFDAVEILNGTPLGEIGNVLAKALFGRRARARLGGSDAHLARAVGSVWTEFAGVGADDLRAAIREGRTRPAMAWGHHLTVIPEFVAGEVPARLRRLSRGIDREVQPDRLRL